MTESIICVDTNVLIWGVRKEAKPEQQHMLHRVQVLLDDLKKRDARIIVPAPAMQEFLIGCSSATRMAQLKALNQHFIVVPFDARCADIAARIAGARSDMTDLFVSNDRVHKVFLKFDLQIAACAVAHRAETFYTHDVKGFKKILENWKVKVHDIPEPQLSLFDTTNLN